MKKLFKILGVVIILMFILFWFYPSLVPNNLKDFPTVPGPENPTLINETSGHVIYGSIMVWENEKWNVDLKALSLPDRKLTLIPLDRSTYSVGGPDMEGRIAYISGDDALANYYLAITSIKNKEKQIIFSRAGSYYEGTGTNLALSHSGKYAVFVSNLVGQQLADRFLKTGGLEIWDISKKQKLYKSTDAMEAGVSFFPDDERIAYTKLSDNKEKIYTYNLKTGIDTYIIEGKDPVVSPDGKSIIYFRENLIFLLDLETKKEREIKLPGIIDYWYNKKGVLGFVGINKVAYWGYATEGAEPQFTKRNSPLVGAKPLITIKIGDLITGEFQTLIEGLDPRESASYGGK